MSDVRAIGGQMALYLVVGGWNTLFGTLAYCGCVWCCEGLGRYGYMAAAVLSMVLGVTHSFLTYKLLVFRTHGRWLAEYLKCWSVYGGASLVNFLLLPISVEAVRYCSPAPYERLAPYVGGLSLTGLTVVVSYFFHRHFTFRKDGVNDERA